MAGNYPDVPGRRMAYDLDGTQGYHVNIAQSVSQMSSAQLLAMNNESTDVASFGSGGVYGTSYTGLIFPELRDIFGIFRSNGVDPSIAQDVQKSSDTTNLLDGTWTSIGNHSFVTTQTPSNIRTGIASVSALGVRAIRLQWYFNNSPGGSMSIHGWHLYGDIAAGQSPNRLRMWHSTSDLELTGAALDWGDVSRGSSATRSFRVKNNSSTLTAGDVTVIVAAPTDTTPSVAGQHTFSLDGVNFSASLNLGSLAPGALSQVIYVKRVTPSNATLSLWTARIIADATTWT
jgi:hypothetical protein